MLGSTCPRTLVITSSGISIGSGVSVQLTFVHNIDTQTAEHATAVAICRIYSMHTMRAKDL